jgi:hypothetical protein
VPERRRSEFGVWRSAFGVRRKILTPREQLITLFLTFPFFELFAFSVVENHLFKDWILYNKDHRERIDRGEDVWAYRRIGVSAYRRVGV